MHAHLQQKMDIDRDIEEPGRGSATGRSYLFDPDRLLGFAVASQALPSALRCSGLSGVDRAVLPYAAPNLVHTPLAAQGLLVGMLTALLFTLPPLLSIRRIKPALILRRDMADVKRRSWRKRLSMRVRRSSRDSHLRGPGRIAGWLIDGLGRKLRRVGGYFIGGLLVSLVLLYAVAALLLKGSRQRSCGPDAGHDTARFCESLSPGQSVAIRSDGLGIGVMFTLTVYPYPAFGTCFGFSPQRSSGMANVFFIDITADQRQRALLVDPGASGTEGSPKRYQRCRRDHVYQRGSR